MSLAYLVNTYPSPTHTFIRREIEALEALGTPVQRFAIRRAEQAADGIHADEDRKVRHVLGAGGLGLARAVVRVALSSPATFLRALVAAVSLGRGSRQGVPLHLAYLAEACVLREWFGDAGIDHVHVHFGTNAVTVAQLCRRLGGPTYSFTVHGPEEFDSPAALKLGDKLADARFAVTISSYGKSQLQRWVDPDHWDRIHVVHCAVDESYLGRPVTPVPDVPRFC
ncbi:MAG TPA: glycosyltransferase, partial [Gemmatimonadaceae bacterium]|nr:glycosyltransferase [Gemmatimonadaceae bacterium]